jgi:hypothetical protein
MALKENTFHSGTELGINAQKSQVISHPFKTEI